MRFVLDDHEELSYSYDRDADVLYLWRGETARAAESLETRDGHLVRLDLETGELVGFTIFEWRSRWQDAADRRLEFWIADEDGENLAGKAGDHHLLVCA